MNKEATPTPRRAPNESPSAQPTVVEALYRAEGAKLWRSICGFAGSRTVADDAVAEAFAQLLRRGSAVLDPKAWVWIAAFRIAAGELKRQR